MVNITLDKLSCNESAEIVSLACDVYEQNRLKAMGLVPGHQVRVLRQGARLVVCSAGIKIGLSRHLAQDIHVVHCESEGC